MNNLLKIVKESGINFSGSLVGTVLNYVMLIMITHLLSPGEYGIFALAQAIIQVSLVFALLGTSRALDRFIPLFNKRSEFGKTKSLIFYVLRMASIANLIVCLVVLALSKLLSVQVFHELRLDAVLKIMIITIPLFSINELVSYAFTGYKELRFQVYIQQLALPLLRIALAAIALVLGIGLLGWTWMYLLAMIGSSLVALFLFRKHILSQLAPVSRIPVSFKEIFSYSWPMSFGLLLFIFWGQFDILFLGYFRTPEEVGVYKFYLQMILVFSLVLMSFAQIYKPMIFEFLDQGNFREIGETYQRISKWVFNINGIGLTTLLLFGTTMIKLFFNKVYLKQPAALFILASANFLMTSFGPAGRTLEAFAKTKLWLLNSVLMLGFNVGLNFVLIPRYGLVGAALSHAASVLIGGLAGLIEIYVLYKLQPYRREHLKYAANFLISSGIIYLVLFFLPKINVVTFLLLLAVFLGLLACGFYLTKTLDEVDLSILRTIRSKLIPG
jgi:O-antigen/teichoic acid export membrane protein